MKVYAQKRMKKLIELLRNNVSRSQFTMDLWFKKTPCKTVACIGGWACTIPSFKKAGLSLELAYSDGEEYDIVLKGHEECNEYALAKFFDISSEEANNLFFNCYSEVKPVHTPKQAASRLEKFLKQKEKNASTN